MRFTNFFSGMMQPIDPGRFESRNILVALTIELQNTLCNLLL